MTKRQQIAKEAARRAAKATYDAVLKAPVRKIATVAGPQSVAPSAKEIAKIAATAAYRSIMSLAQVPDMSFPVPDESNVQGTAMSLGYRNLANYLANKTEERKPAAQAEVADFLAAYEQRKTDQRAPNTTQLVEVVKSILRNAGLNA